MTVAIRPPTPADADRMAGLLNAIIAIGGTPALRDPFDDGEGIAATYRTGEATISKRFDPRAAA